MSTEEIKGTSLSAGIREVLRREILEGKYSQGEALGEAQLAERFGVSRTPIREALRELETESLVEIRPNRGAAVIGISREDIRDIYSIRSLLEGWAATKAAERATDDKLEEIAELVDLMELYEQRGDVEKLVNLDHRFHEKIYSLSGNRIMERKLSELHEYVSQVRGLSLTKGSRAKESVEEHRAIYKALKEHQPEEAGRLMSEHLANARNNLTENGLL